jgi:uncharacterized membrane protein YphA (DoxX/SURF4 family)
MAISIPLSTLLIVIGVFALGFTAGTYFIKKHKSLLMSFAQWFCGILFLFSGWVKAIDPMGTAFKMEQYFGEFERTFSQTALSFVSPIFPALSSISIWFSVGMIVFEIILGLMLILGYKPKLTAWLFFLLVVFFTILTGFTYLTAYVPSGVNFFNFSGWSAYKESNMKVTDCGCFGDFLKLLPKISFFKDLGLLIPSIFFLFKHSDMHDLFGLKINRILTGITTVGILGYCLYNFIIDEPHIDFRPFKNGANIAMLKEKEAEAQAKVKILAYKLKNLSEDKMVEVPMDQYLADSTYWNTSKYEVVDQIKSELTVPKSKISEFSITDYDGVEVNDLFLKNPKNNFMIVSYKAKFDAKPVEVDVQDSIFKIDTIFNSDKSVKSINKAFINIKTSKVKKTDFVWPASYLVDMAKMKTIVDQAKKEGHDVTLVIGAATKDMANDLKKDTGIDATFLTADDIFLKTIMRSNPGLILWKNGTLVQKWHKNQLPEYTALKNQFIK